MDGCGLVRSFRLAVFAGLLLVSALPARAALQFDVFLGYDDLVREANWFPIACEIHNDGPSFKGVVEINAEQFGSGQTRRVALELPTNTRKRFVVPVFGATGRFGSWNVRLLDERGKVRAERTQLTPRRRIAWEATVVGALAGSFAGLPKMPERGNVVSEISPEVARLQAEYFPDNVIALEGLDALYVNTAKALDLTQPQSAAIVTWVAGGGHLIASIDQPGDFNGLPWLKSLLPAEVTGVASTLDMSALEDLASRTSEAASKVVINQRGRPRSNTASAGQGRSQLKPELGSTEMQIFQTSLRDGRVTVGTDGSPMVIEARRGRGKISLLAFSAEREPFRSWKNKGWFWAGLTGVAPEALSTQQVNHYSYQSIDGVFGAMIDSKQVRKLPVSWLLLLLVVYLLVIGPIDQYTLKKLNKQMLTWITFPCYVVGFSLLIYWIGFMLRAGETEWNELHIVDVVPRGQKADLRGRTFGSIYSPSNARYEFGVAAKEGSRKFASMRGEFLGSYGQQDSTRGTIDQQGDGFVADMFVPVWTSQLCISDWLQSGEAPLTATVEKVDKNYKVRVENKLPRPLSEARIVVNGRVMTLGSLEANKARVFTLTTTEGQRLQDFVRQNANQFSGAINQRRQAFGDNTRGRISNLPLSSMAASFVSTMTEGSTAYNYNETFVMPNGLDLSDLAGSGQAILLAWDGTKSLVPPLNQFNPRRGSSQTLIRLALPVAESN